MEHIAESWPVLAAFITTTLSIVGVFIRYLAHRDKEFSKLLIECHQLQRENTKALSESTSTLAKLTATLEGHDTSVREMRQALERAQPRQV